MIDITITIALFIFWSFALFEYVYLQGRVRGYDEAKSIYDKFLDEQIKEWENIGEIIKNNFDEKMLNLFSMQYDLFERVQWLQHKQGKEERK